MAKKKIKEVFNPVSCTLSRVSIIGNVYSYEYTTDKQEVNK